MKGNCLKRLCLSFALFKLLRRRFEHAPVGDDKARDCRALIFNDGGLLVGLRYDEADGGESAAEALFQVVHDEVHFLCENYHSVVPVAFESPSFLVVNYFFVLVVVALLCLMTVILCGNGDAVYAFRSIGNDNYVLRFGIAKLTACVFSKAIQSPSAFFSALDLATTALLFAIYFYEEIWEFFVFLFSDWFMVSLLASYTTGKSKSGWFKNLSFGFAIRCLIGLRSKLSQPRLRFRQFSALNMPYAYTSMELVHEDVKKSIIDYLEKHVRALGTVNYTPLSNGWYALQRFPCFHHLSWACNSPSVVEVILTWHIATSIFEAENPPQPNKADQGGRARCSVGQMLRMGGLPFFKKNKADQEQPDKTMTSRRVAISLSKYCAYLVAFHPQLLPEYTENAEGFVYGMKAELRGMLGRWAGYYLSRLSKRVQKIVVERASIFESKDVRVVSKGVRLASELKKCQADEAWAVLAGVWTELVVFVAPSSDEECVKAHEKVLEQGVEFITVLWALATHTGVSRPATDSTADSMP